jgi:putative nucleotidyltransferase with HDIG domain
MSEIEKEKNGLDKLLDSSYPLLQWFKQTAPGTFKHSQSVSSMIESVSDALGLDVLKMRVCALYHDIGKASINPEWYSENQLDDENIHNSLDPWISAQLITRHVSDSVLILINNKDMPRDIIEIISQHHGTSLAEYFYKKSDAADSSKFKYPSLRPQTVEAAVLMVVDHIEATSKSMVQSGKFDPKMIIETTINGLLESEQLDEVIMPIGNLKKIKISLAKELSSIYQKRIDYSELQGEEK